jgi:RNA polymerase sigma-70 factor, ECF subfamily
MATTLTSESDERLAALAASERSEEAFAELFRRYRRQVYLWCFRYTQDADAAVDLTQEIFIRVFRSLDGFAGRSRFSTWVYRIAQNHCLNAVTRRRRREDDISELEIEDRRDAQRLREAELAGELEQLLADAATRMKEGELEAFVLHYRDGLTVDEITRMLGCENATGARTLIQNARRKFHRLTARRSGDE